MSKQENSGEGRPSDNQAPAPSPSSAEEQNRSEEAARLQEQQHQSFASMGGGQNNPRAGGPMGMHPYQQMHPQQQMMMPPHLHYLQEMRRAEELMMASESGGPRGMNDFAAMNAARFPSAQHQWPDAQREGGGGPPMMGNMPPSQQDRSSSSYGGDPSVARMPPQEHNPAALLSLLQQEQERLMNLMRQQRNMPESSLPPAKRRRLPTNNANSGNAEHHQWMAQNSMARMAQGFPDAGPSSESTQPVRERRRHVQSFPVKLMEAINEHSDEHVLAWLPDGKSFVVVDPERFVDNVLLGAFKGGKYSSFVRKLNRWGFSRLISGTGTIDCFHNPLFQRDRPELCALITSGDRDDTLGVNPLLLGTKPSLNGIDKYFALREKRGKSEDGAHTVSNPSHDASSETKEKEEEAKTEESSSKPRAKKGNGESLKDTDATGL